MFHLTPKHVRYPSGARVTLVGYWWECKLVQFLWKSAGGFLNKQTGRTGGSRGGGRQRVERDRGWRRKPPWTRSVWSGETASNRVLKVGE